MPSRTSLRLAAAAIALLALPAIAAVPVRHAVPTRARSESVDRRLDVNELNLSVSNLGWIGYNPFLALPGLFFPRGTTQSVLYAGGLWVGATVAGSPRLALAEYSSEFQPGGMPGGVGEDPADPDLVVWKMKAWTGDPSDTAEVVHTAGELAADQTLDPVVHHSWSDYVTHAAPHGAPVREWKLPGAAPGDSVTVLGPDVAGDLMLWCVFNDDAPSRHTNAAGGTAPLGIEVRQTVFGFDRPGPLARAAFVHWHIVNRGTNTLDATRAAFWLDPDLGGSADDLVGCNGPRSLGFAYNATNADAIYGSAPPALGVDLFDDGVGPGAEHGAAAFRRYVNGIDPRTAAESWNTLQGLAPDGSPIVDPTTNRVTTFEVTGDPVALTGWVDSNPADRRMLIARGPHLLAPGDSLDVWAALIVGSGNDRLASWGQLRCADDWIDTVFHSGFALPGPPLPDCTLPLNCPRTPDHYALECPEGPHLSNAQLWSLGAYVDGRAQSFGWVADEVGNFCQTLSGTADARARAKAQYAAFLANVLAASIPVVPSGEPPIRLDSALPLTIPGVLGTTVGEMATAASLTVDLRGQFETATPGAPDPYLPADFVLRAFGGGADYAFNFFFLGSSLDPATMPDSFHTVTLEFDPAHPGKAHRYLRYETAGGFAPSPGRVYAYAGYVDVPFVARDSVTGEVLDVGYAERVVTENDGTIQLPANQPATFDSTWAPDSSQFGGREYLFVLARPTTGSPRPELAIDGALADGALPWEYVCAFREPAPPVALAAGDRFVLSRRRQQSAGVDSRLLDLEGLPLSDPDVAAAYDAIATGLGAINAGIGVPNACDRSTATLASLVSASATPGGAELEWLLAGAASATVQRSSGSDGWTSLASVNASPTGRLVWSETGLEPGTRVGWRLALGAGGGAPYAGETWLDVPREARLAIRGFTPNPGRGEVQLAFTLASRERASLQMLDLAGRRVLLRDVSAFGPGTHRVPLGATLPAGVYWLRLAQGRDVVVTRGVLVR